MLCSIGDPVTIPLVCTAPHPQFLLSSHPSNSATAYQYHLLNDQHYLDSQVTSYHITYLPQHANAMITIVTILSFPA
jgi:hypothetical protein